jgi:hypothetical protein
MTIKQQGGIFGRNPTFNNVDVEGTLTVNGEPISDFGTMATQDANAVAITGGNIDGTVIGATSQAAISGTSGSFSTTLGVTGDLTTYGSNNLEGGYSFQRAYATWPYFVFSRAQGTRASPTSIGNGQTLSEIYFSGYTNGQYRNGASIQAKVSAGVSGDEIPTTLTFSTTADGANSPTDRWAINHTGNLVALQSGNGIDFSATSGTGTSELFSDYEEGTFTATRSGFTEVLGGGTITSTGVYTKVGRTVTVQITLTCTGAATIEGVGGAGSYFNLPFSVTNNTPGTWTNNTLYNTTGAVVASDSNLFIVTGFAASGNNRVFTATYPAA